MYTRKDGTTFEAYRPSDQGLVPDWYQELLDTNKIYYEDVTKEVAKRRGEKKDAPTKTYTEHQLVLINEAGEFRRFFPKTVVLYEPESYPKIWLAWASKISKVSDFECHEDEIEPEGNPYIKDLEEDEITWDDIP